MGTIKIVIADTAFIVRKGIKHLIVENSDFEFAGEVADAKSLELLFKSSLPDVLIVDHCCDDCFSLDFISTIKTDYPSVQILVISHEKSIEKINGLIRIGIKNYVLKNCSEQELSKAIYNCSLNKKFFSEDIIDALLENEIASKQTKPIDDLTERESEIIRLLVGGNRPKEVAEMLHISLYTVNTHKKNIYRKLGVNHSYELAKYAVESGFMIQP